MDKKVTGWFTMNGKHIPIYEGESKADAVNRSIAKDAEDKKQADIQRNREEAKKLNKKSDKETATARTQSDHKKAVAELSKDKYEDGTYDINTKKTVDFPDGYQVTFCQIGDNYSDNEYARKVNECLRLSSDGKTYAGKFEGTPEISFHCADRDKAVKYAKANNQISIWDWKAMQDAIAYESSNPDDADGIAYRWLMCQIKTGGTGRRK